MAKTGKRTHLKKTCVFITLAITGLIGTVSAAEIEGIDPIYTKDPTVYTGNNGDTLIIDNPPLYTHWKGQWTMAMTISGLSITTGDDVAVLFTYTTDQTANEGGLGYQLDADGNLTLNAGGWDYTGNGGTNSPWKSSTIGNINNGQPLSLFFSFNGSQFSIFTMFGDDESSLMEIASISGVNGFEGHWMETINFSTKGGTDGRSTEWAVPNGVNGSYTLHNFEIYDGSLTADQMKQYANSAAEAIPEPATATLGLLGLGILIAHRRRSPSINNTFYKPKQA